jgi:hypothetical protein
MKRTSDESLNPSKKPKLTVNHAKKPSDEKTGFNDLIKYKILLE